MNESISHSFADESMDAKAKWFKSLSVEERMDVFVAYTRLILEINPQIAKKKHDRPASDRVRVLNLEDVLTSEQKESDSEDRSA